MKKLLLKTKKFKAAVFVILCLVMGLNVNAQTWPWIYDGSVLPDAATPAWTAGDAGTVVAAYSIVNESGNNVLYETTTASADKKSFKLPGTVIKQPKSATWLIRAKAGNKPTGTEFEINSKLNTSVTRGYFRLVNGSAGGVLKTNYITTTVTSFPTDSILDVKNYHTYRITVDNNTDYKIYLDENATPIIAGTGASTTNTQFLRIGDVGSNFTEGYIDWMAWDTTGAYPPSATLPAGVTVDNVPFAALPSVATANAATSIGQTTFTANWGTTAGASGYILDVAADAAFTTFVTGYSGRNVTNVVTYNITGLTANTPYYYRVRAYSTGGSSANSNAITVTTSAPALLAQTITFTVPTDKIYGAAAFDITDAVGGASGNPVTLTSSNTSVATVSGTTITILAAGTTTIEANQAGNGSYSAATAVQHDLVIAKASLSVTTEPATRMKGLANPTFVLKYTGFAGNDTKASLTTEPTATCAANASSAVGDYPVVVSGGSATNYTFTYVNGTLSVTVNTGISSLTGAALKAYPNPVSSKLTIEVPSFDGKSTVSVSTVSGATITSRKIESTVTELNLNGIAPGFYLIRIETPQGISIKEIVKQ